MMGARVGLVLFFVLCASWVCDGRRRGPRLYDSLSMDENECNVCLHFASLARYHFGKIKNHNEIIETLRQSCSRDPPRFKQMCIASVDLFAPSIMTDLSTIDPEHFCSDVYHCEKYVLRYIEQLPYLHRDKCGVCRLAVEVALRRLKDPETQLKITEVLLKACDSSDEYEKKLMCKKIVLENWPAIFVSFEKYVEAKGLCTNFCGGSEQISQVVDEFRHSDF